MAKNDTKKQKSSTSFYMDKDLIESVEAIAELKGKSRSAIVEEAMRAVASQNQEEIEQNSKKPMILTVMSFKGGVAKTTSAANLAICLGETGARVLIIDLDGQGSISQYLGVYDYRAEEPCIADVMLADSRGNRQPLKNVIIETEYKNVFIAPSSFRFSDADSKMRAESSPNVDARLQYAIEDLSEEDQYDYIIVDCPPSLGLVVTNAITALEAGSDKSMIVIPVRVDGFAIAGLANTINTIENVARERRTPVRKWKLLRTIAEKRSVAYKEGIKLIESQFKNAEFFTSCISKATVVVESTLAMEPLMVYDPNSKAAVEYRMFAQEVEDINNG